MAICWGFLGLLLCHGAVSLSFMTEADWMSAYKDLDGCTVGLFGYCSFRTEGGDVLVQPFAKSQGACAKALGVWHDRYPSWASWRNESLEADTALHVLSSDPSPTFAAIVKFSSAMRVNSISRASMPKWLQAAQLMPCATGEMYAFAHASRAGSLDAKSEGIIEHALALPPSAKLSSHLLAILNHPEESEKAGKPNDFQFFPGLLVGLQGAEGSKHKAAADDLALKWQLELQNKATVKSAADDTVHIRVSSFAETLEVAAEVAKDPLCLSVEPQPIYRAVNEQARGLCQSGQTTAGSNTLPFWDAGIMGQDQVVGVADSGLDHESCYFRDDDVPVTVSTGNTFNSDTHRKIVQYVAYADNTEGEDGGHGTHVCGSVAGNEHLDGGLGEANEAAGGAPQAKIAFFDIGEPNAQYLNVPGSLYNDLFPPAYARGARIHTNSWGSDSNSYGTNARDIDRFMFENQDFLVLFANGNSGGNGAGSVGTPATSKNNIAVGASQNGPNYQNYMASFSSLGPRYDGGFSPVVSAPGDVITSARSAVSGESCSTVGMRGTSMATPLTAGHAALVRQYFMEGFYPTGTKVPANAFTPMAALIKAVLVNGAHTLTGGGLTEGVVSNQQGYGAIQMNNALKLDTSTRLTFVDGDFDDMPTLNDGDSDVTYTFTITSEIPFVAALAWSDAAAASGASRLLVNDLDLVIECTSGCGDQTSWGSNGLEPPVPCYEPTSFVTMNTLTYGSESGYRLVDSGGTTVCEANHFPDQSTVQSACCIADGSYTLTCVDSYGDGWHGGSITIAGSGTYCGSFSEASTSPDGYSMVVNNVVIVGVETPPDPDDQVDETIPLDTLNNVEKIIVDPAPVGAVFVVNVKASDIPEGPQPYALSISGDFTVGAGPPSNTPSPSHTPQTLSSTPSPLPPSASSSLTSSPLPPSATPSASATISAPGDCLVSTIGVNVNIWGEEISWTLGHLVSSQSNRMTVACSGGPYPDGYTGEEECCMVPQMYKLSCIDAYGDGWHGASITIGNAGTTITIGDDIINGEHTFCTNFGSGFREDVDFILDVSCDDTRDCAGVCGGSAVVDSCGLCDGGDSSCVSHSVNPWQGGVDVTFAAKVGDTIDWTWTSTHSVVQRSAKKSGQPPRPDQTQKVTAQTPSPPKRTTTQRLAKRSDVEKLEKMRMKGLEDPNVDIYQEHKIIIGEDDRRDIYDLDEADPHRIRGIQSVAALVRTSNVGAIGSDGTYNFPNGATLQQSRGMCDGQAFNNQATEAFCSGTLIRDNMIMSAGHCIDSSSCGTTSFVFNYYVSGIDGDGNPEYAEVTADDVYTCESVEMQLSGGQDWAVVTLDRTVNADRHTPVPIQTQNTPVEANQDIVMIGFPSGLPMKVDAGATVADPRASSLDYFTANTDSFGGNSGSGIFTDDASLTVGILVRGATDYVTEGGCTVVNVVAEGYGSEACSYAWNAAEAVPNDPALCDEMSGTLENCGSASSVSDCRYRVAPEDDGKMLCFECGIHGSAQLVTVNVNAAVVWRQLSVANSASTSYSCSGLGTMSSADAIAACAADSSCTGLFEYGCNYISSSGVDSGYFRKCTAEMPEDIICTADDCSSDTIATGTSCLLVPTAESDYVSASPSPSPDSGDAVVWRQLMVASSASNAYTCSGLGTMSSSNAVAACAADSSCSGLFEFGCNYISSSGVDSGYFRRCTTSLPDDIVCTADDCSSDTIATGTSCLLVPITESDYVSTSPSPSPGAPCDKLLAEFEYLQKQGHSQQDNAKSMQQDHQMQLSSLALEHQQAMQALVHLDLQKDARINKLQAAVDQATVQIEALRQRARDAESRCQDTMTGASRADLRPDTAIAREQY